MKFQFPQPLHEYRLTDIERSCFYIKEPPGICSWVEKNIQLKRGYTNTGYVKLHPWQREPLENFASEYQTYLCGPVQSGKSFIADCAMYYAMAVLGLEGMVIYNNHKTAARVFKRRIRPMILGNPALRRLWSGVEDDLAIDNIQLLNSFWGIGSSQNRNDIASFPAGMVVWSEVSKSEAEGWDVYTEIVGRQNGYKPDRRRIICESSPNEKGDPFYNLIYAPGVAILRPFVPCPICGEYQEMIDAQVKVADDYSEKCKADPSLLRVYKEIAVRYECIHCKGEINESDRPKMWQRVVWAKPEITERITENYTFKQEPEKVDPDGTVHYDREFVITKCYNWNRFVDPDYKFYECLARFFVAKRTPDGLKTYLNNDMAKFNHPANSGTSQYRIEQLVMNSDYFVNDADFRLPDGVLVVVISLDTQGPGWYYLVEGYGRSMESWILWHGFVAHAITDDSAYDYNLAASKIAAVVNGLVLKKKNGAEVGLLGGYIDKGGHRGNAVVHICNAIGKLIPYVGSPRDNPSKAIIENTGRGFHYGKSEQLSELVSARLNSSMYHFPADSSRELLLQISKQYHYNVTDNKGNIKREWKHGGEDHLRDCANMNLARILYEGFDKMLFDENYCADLEEVQSMPRRTGEHEHVETHMINRGSSYFLRGR